MFWVSRPCRAVISRPCYLTQTPKVRITNRAHDFKSNYYFNYYYYKVNKTNNHCIITSIILQLSVNVEHKFPKIPVIVLLFL